jgi:hypothetical protein
MICFFFVAAVLSAWQVKAQEKAGQVADIVRRLQSQSMETGKNRGLRTIRTS